MAAVAKNNQAGMKYCPQCHRYAADDGPVLCRYDGAVLESPPLAENRQAGRPRIVSPAPLLLGIGLICAVAIVALVLISKSAGGHGTTLPESPKAPSATPIPRSEIDRFVQEWKQAWESRDIEAYSRLYADSFVGKTYSPKHEAAIMSRSEWLNDKRQKFQYSGAIMVGIGSLTVYDDGADAIVSFRQDYRSGSYKDYGTKTLRLRRQGEETISIVQEDFTPSIEPR